MIKRLFLFLFLLFAIFTAPSVSAQEYDISSFVRDDCAHCKDQKAFIEDVLLPNNPDISIRYVDIYTDEGKELFDAFTGAYGLVKGTPITMVGDAIIQGYESDVTTGALMQRLVTEYEGPAKTFEDVMDGSARMANDFSLEGVCQEECTEKPQQFVRIPVIGKTVNVGALSLSGISLVLGFIDGFNPCALWVLVMFLLVLSQLGSHRKMWEYAGIFILAEAIMYYLILNVWFTAWDFIDLNHIVTPFIGLLAIGSGIYFGYKFFTFKNVCTVADDEDRKSISQRVKQIAKKPMSIGVFFAILALAFSVNIFEFACSIGIPQTFTKILELNQLSWLGTQWHMFLYILMYMFDDLIVFGIALYSMEKIGITQKYSKWATLLGAISMLILGAIMLWRPELLIF
ncbi:MAG: glutaredoxin [Candidatus Magasanikbacteria bacterium CG10_big_fil_rev_8_21_14_0_10_47_10]|uniref:Glutaredoxin n=1 Tax=Candidatus Magasanikbacteria bacterium CG10_big_fil_rev_8_21_14_0_10_47_10 TaxID=1974652 RepID=A0A2H0TRA1_9BACT|nr:MAG: glutaredoxin [Candidatus Magasanikbacteria bacterium CG10_big_fil_rev_8_21_14_0_10_47_10]